MRRADADSLTGAFLFALPLTQARMLVITGATGQIGRPLVARLLDLDEPIRVIARDPSRLPLAVRDRVEVITGSYADRATIDEAFEGASCVFWLPLGPIGAASAHDAFVELSRPAADAVGRYGVTHVVTVTALGRGWPSDAGHATASIAMDDMFAESGAQLRALACPSLMENTLRQLSTMREQGVFFGASHADHKVPLVAAVDVAAVAASLLRDRSWVGSETLPLLGPEDVSPNDQAAILSEVLGRPVRYQETSTEELRAMMLRRGASAGMAQAMVDMTIAKNAGIDGMIPRTVENSTPTTFRAWCQSLLSP